jgi:hypothetical protein
MFPNMRLFVGALLASVVTLCCGFGVFAAFRVNHEPLSRLPADTVALQLVANEAAGPPPAWQVPISSRFEASVSDARSARVMTDATTLLPISRLTIQPSSLQTTRTVRPETAIDALRGRVPPQHESQPTVLSAAAALSAPAMSSALIANVNEQPTPSALTATQSAPAASPASTGTSPVQQAPAAEAQPVQSAPDIKQDAADKTGEQATVPIPAVAVVEQSASQPGDIIGTPPKAAVPEPKARPKLVTRPTLRKEVRQALQRRRLAARKRIALKTAASNMAQSSFQNSTFFQSAPDAFQRQPATNRSARKSTNAADNSAASSPFGWASSQ